MHSATGRLPKGWQMRPLFDRIGTVLLPLSNLQQQRTASRAGGSNGSTQQAVPRSSSCSWHYDKTTRRSAGENTLLHGVLQQNRTRTQLHHMRMYTKGHGGTQKAMHIVPAARVPLMFRRSRERTQAHKQIDLDSGGPTDFGGPTDVTPSPRRRDRGSGVQDVGVLPTRHRLLLWRPGVTRHRGACCDTA